MEVANLNAISSVDGRYYGKTKALSSYLSEAALLKYRTLIEVEWLKTLSQVKAIKELPAFSADEIKYLDDIIENFGLEAAETIKHYESKTNHDVKAVEYYVKAQLEKHPTLNKHVEFIHFACTSEDINNLSYARMLQDATTHVLVPNLQQIIVTLEELAENTKHVSMLSRTHGQAASPTTLGKEIKNTCVRLTRQMNILEKQKMAGKINGAVGNFNAHVAAYPEVDWYNVSKEFVLSLDLDYQAFTTQIEPHDCVAEYAHLFSRVHTILIDFARDIWSYISLGYFNQKMVSGEVGSSTMPHKVNPIDFENAEGNLGLANAIWQHLANKLPTSRWQRDLSDSTVMRVIGTAAGHGMIAYQALQKGIGKLDVNLEQIESDLDKHWEVLTEAVQTVMRRYGIARPYETLKALSRGKRIDKTTYAEIIAAIDLPEQVKTELLELTPAKYIGLASELFTKS